MLSTGTAFLGQWAHFFTVFGVFVASYLVLKCLWLAWSIVRTFVFPKVLGSGVDLTEMGKWAGKRIIQQLQCYIQSTTCAMNDTHVISICCYREIRRVI